MNLRGCRAVLFAGQSNCIGPSAGTVPSGIPISVSVLPYWYTRLLDTPDVSAYSDLEPKELMRGAELALGLGMIQEYRRPAILKLARGATFIAQWVGSLGGAYSAAFLSEIAAAKAAIEALIPNEAIAWSFVWAQGESEMNSSNASTADLWAERFALLLGEVETALGQTLRPHIVLTSSQTAAQLNFTVLRARQLAAAAAANGWAINTDDLPLSGDGLHFDYPEQHIIGGRILASLRQETSMSISHGTPTRDAVAATVTGRVDAGAAAGKMLFYDGVTLISTVTLADPAFAAPSSGYAALNGVPLTGVTAAAGDPDSFTCTDSDGNVCFSGTVSGSGGGGDVELNPASLTLADNVVITGGGYTAPP